MWNRWLLLMVVVGALVGYSLVTPSVQAQSEPFPFRVGETVTLSYAQDVSLPSFGSSIQCTVAEIRGNWVKCGPRDRIGASDRTERWVTMKYVVQISKRDD
jgi:hypothetical protein